MWQYLKKSAKSSQYQDKHHYFDFFLFLKSSQWKLQWSGRRGSKPLVPHGPAGHLNVKRGKYWGEKEFLIPASDWSMEWTTWLSQASRITGCFSVGQCVALSRPTINNFHHLIRWINSSLQTKSQRRGFVRPWSNCQLKLILIILEWGTNKYCNYNTITE